jgi:hypothetical protein
MIKKILTAIYCAGLIYLLIAMDYPKNPKKVAYIAKDTIEIFEDNFDSTWQVYGCTYYGFKKQDNEN